MSVEFYAMKVAITHSVAMQASVLTAHDAIIDARSPAEYAEDHLPGAISLPVLEDEERARVGTLYKQCRRSPRKLGGAGGEEHRALPRGPARRPAQGLATSRVLLARRQAQRRLRARAARGRLGRAHA
jgi:hypothetical protein